MYLRFLTVVFTLILLPSSEVKGQSIVKPKYLNLEIDTTIEKEIYAQLDSLFLQIEEGRISEQILGDRNAKLSKACLSELNSQNTDFMFLRRELLNFYHLGNHKYNLDLAIYSYDKKEGKTVLTKIINLIAEKKDEDIRLSLPLDYLTRTWKRKKIGLSTYFFPSEMDVENAEIFDLKNKAIAAKLGEAAEGFDFYLASNYQEISALLGVKYNIHENGYAEDGYGVVEGVIFGIRGSEDFAHDIMHYYSGMIHPWGGNRNWLAEEGIATDWGNAYYADSLGQMIELDDLALELEQYLQENPSTSLLQLFDSNNKVLTKLSAKMSVRTCISGIICEEIEKQHGMKGIFAMITCGRYQRDYSNYLAKTNELIGLNRTNFDQRVAKYLEDRMEALEAERK